MSDDSPIVQHLAGLPIGSPARIYCGRGYDTTTVVLSADVLYRQAAEVAVLTVYGRLVSPPVVGLVHPRAGLAGPRLGWWR